MTQQEYVATLKRQLEGGALNPRAILEGADELKRRGEAGESLQGFAARELVTLAQAIRQMVIVHEAAQIPAPADWNTTERQRLTIDRPTPPTLEGSEKQVAWAEKIRETTVSQWNARMEKAVLNSQDQPGGLKADPGEQRWLTREAPLIAAWLGENVFAQLQAAWWIQHRNTNWLQHAQTVLRAQLRLARHE